MCTLVETPDVTILLDAGVSLAPYRFSLLPHPLEFQAIASLRSRIAEAADKAQVVTISHYHFDHHTPSYEDWLVNWTQDSETARQIYQDKTIIMKNPRQHINPSQRERAWIFQKTGGKVAKQLSIADGRTFTFSKTTLRFSPAVPHGPEDSMLGWVVMAIVEYDGERFLHAPDVQGPMANQTATFIRVQKPDVVIVGGPPYYLGGFKVDEGQILKGNKHLGSIIEDVPVTILEHHALRDATWQERTQSLFETAQKSEHQLVTAAEYLGQENLFLESKRKQLYTEQPPSKEFMQWTRTNEAQISHVKPPI
jgi:uncharacterized protein